MNDNPTTPTCPERGRWRAAFASSLVMLEEMEAYYCPHDRRVRFRSVTAIRRFGLPAGAVLVGRYAHPFASRDFLKDLDDALARIQLGTLARLPV